MAKFETSLYDEWGCGETTSGSRISSVLRSMATEVPIHNSYLNLGSSHPLLAGLEDATRIINGVNRVGVKTIDSSVSSPLTVVPSYPDLPMEEV